MKLLSCIIKAVIFRSFSNFFERCVLLLIWHIWTKLQMHKFQNESEMCSSCADYINEQTLLSVNSQYWHSKCLRCSQCSIQLENHPTCFIKGDSIYCKNCYNRQVRRTLILFFSIFFHFFYSSSSSLINSNLLLICLPDHLHLIFASFDCRKRK